MRKNAQATSSDIEKDVFVFQNELSSRQSSFVYSHDIQSAQDDDAPYHWGGGIDHSDSERPSYHDRIWTFWKETGDDLKAIRWGHLWKRIFAHVFALGCIASLVWAITLLSFPQYRPSSSCSPDGTFSVETLRQSNGYATSYRWWDQNSLFAIDLAFFDMDFATAKGVDILWDVGFGRGMQGIVAVISYTVCTKAISRLMERTPVTLRTFEAVTLESDTIPALWKLSREMLSWQSLRTWLIIGWIGASTVMLLGFQTLSSAMTGYTTRVSGFVQTPAGERVPVGQFEAVQYIIHDGHRLGGDYYDGYPVVLPYYGDPNLYAYRMDGSNVSAYIHNETDPITYWIGSSCQQYAPSRREPGSYSGELVFGWVPFRDGMSSTTYAQCQLLWHMSEYTSINGFLGLNNTASVFNNSGNLIELSAPALNVSAYFMTPQERILRNAPWSSIPYGYHWKDPEGNEPFNNTQLLWAYGKTAMNATTLGMFGTCQQSDIANIRYQWGFSTLLLLIFCAIMLLWSIGTYSMWLDAYFNSALDVSKRDIGLKRAVLDINTAMARDLDSISTDAVGNKQLKKMVKNNRLDYTDLVDHQNTRSAHLAAWWRNLDLRQWMRDEMVWLILFALFLTMMSLSYTTKLTLWWSPLVSHLPLLGVMLVLVIGRAHRSRWIWFAIFFLGFGIPNIYFLAERHRHRRRRY